MTTSPQAGEPQIVEFEVWDLFGFRVPGLRVEGYPVREFGRVLHWQVSRNCIAVAWPETRDQALAVVAAEKKAVTR